MITKDLYEKFVEAFIFYNDALFANELPEPLITLQRKRNVRGFFGNERFVSRTENQFTIGEIALNPDLFQDRTDRDILSTLVHEMVHLWQSEFGEDKPKRPYHNKEWSAKMEQIGLVPSTTGTTEGKKTGAKMTHYINEDGDFAYHTEILLDGGFKLPLEGLADAPKAAADKSKNKIGYICPTCGCKAWAKPNAALLCATCSEESGEFVRYLVKQ